MNRNVPLLAVYLAEDGTCRVEYTILDAESLGTVLASAISTARRVGVDIEAACELSESFDAVHKSTKTIPNPIVIRGGYG